MYTPSHTLISHNHIACHTHAYTLHNCITRIVTQSLYYILTHVLTLIIHNHITCLHSLCYIIHVLTQFTITTSHAHIHDHTHNSQSPHLTHVPALSRHITCSHSLCYTHTGTHTYNSQSPHLTHMLTLTVTILHLTLTLTVLHSHT